METKTACVVGRRNESASERVHLCERADHAGIAEVIFELSASEARAGCRRNRGVQLVASARIVSLKLVIDFRRGAQLFFQTISAN